MDTNTIIGRISFILLLVILFIPVVRNYYDPENWSEERLFRQLIKTRGLDEEVITCIKNRERPETLRCMLLHYYNHNVYTNKLLRHLFALQPSQRIIDAFRKHNGIDGFDAELEIKKYLSWQERERKKNLGIDCNE